MSLDKYVEELVEDSLDNTNRFISKIHPDMDLNYNSFNISLGDQSSGKTIHFMKQMIKLSVLMDEGQVDPNNFGDILYITDNEDDYSFSQLMQYISLPIKKANYESFQEQFAQYLAKKSANPNEKDRQTIVFCDDASFFFSNGNNKFLKYLTQLRHIKCIFFLCLQMWKSLAASIKSQLTTVFIAPGFSREQLGHVYRQIVCKPDFEQFIKIYKKIPGKRAKLMCNKDGTLRYVNKLA